MIAQLRSHLRKRQKQPPAVRRFFHVNSLSVQTIFTDLVSILRKFMRKKEFRYLICGIITAAFNIILILILIEIFNLNTPLLRNIANVLAIEISLLFSFFIYKIGVWPQATWSLKKISFYQIPLYHIAVGLAVTMRSLIVFPILDWLGVNYVVNTLVGILLGAILNYLLSDQIVFKQTYKDKKSNL